jgi:hypothetical protein
MAQRTENANFKISCGSFEICQERRPNMRTLSSETRCVYLGMVPFLLKSYSIACRRALANALKVASIMWWEFFPASWTYKKSVQLRYVLNVFTKYKSSDKIASSRYNLITRAFSGPLQWNNQSNLINNMSYNLTEMDQAFHRTCKQEQEIILYLPNMQCHARGIDNRLKEMLHQLRKWVIAVSNIEHLLVNSTARTAFTGTTQTRIRTCVS